MTAVVEPSAAGARRPAYVGLVTRAIAFALDAAVINLVAIVVTALTMLILSVITVPESLRALAIAAGGIVYLAWVAGYFVVFWTTTGQTPGDRLLHFRVRPRNGATRLRPRAAVVRFVSLTLAAIPLFAGFLMILVDDRRRGLHDWLAGTEVVEVDQHADGERSGTSSRPSSAARATAADREDTSSLR